MSETERQLRAANQLAMSAIRTHHHMVSDLQRMMREQFNQYVATHGDYPPRGWNKSWLYQIEFEQEAMLGMAGDIARTKARDGYFEIIPVSDADIRGVLDAALTSS